MNNEFRETKVFFNQFLDVDSNEPLDWDMWMKFPDDRKSAVLFLKFYSEITLAWEKTKSFYTPTSDGVSIVMQYLEKNVPLIKENKNKYNGKYIYKVAYNCLYCECHDRCVLKNAYNHEVSADQLGSDEDSDFSYYDILEDESEDIECKLDAIEFESISEKIWNMLDEVDIETEIIIEKMLGTDTDVIWNEISSRSDYPEYVDRYSESHPGKPVKLIPLSESRMVKAVQVMRNKFEHSEYMPQFSKFFQNMNR